MIIYFYTGILSLFYVALSLFVIAGRWKYKAGIGDRGELEMQKRIRIHGNFSEYIPFGLLIFFLNEQSGASVYFLHTLGVLLVLGRILHATGILKTHKASLPRFIGMNCTFAVLLIGGIRLIILSIF